ncbi:MAG: hypothetical protein WKG07_29925 [Hymenobacter sp.]
MVSDRLPAVPRQAPAAGVAAGHVRRPRHRRHVARCRSQRAGRAAAARIADGTAAAQKRDAGPPRAGRRDASASPRTWWRASAVLLDLGLGYLALERSTPTLSPGELQRLRLATQLRSNLFGVVYVLDEPSAGPAPGRHRGAARRPWPAQGGRQLALRRRARPRRDPPRRLARRRRARRAGEQGGRVLYSGPPAGLARRGGVADAGATCSTTRRTLPRDAAPAARAGCSLRGVTRNNLARRSTSPSRSACSPPSPACRARASRRLVSQALVELVRGSLGHERR